VAYENSIKSTGNYKLQVRLKNAQKIVHSCTENCATSFKICWFRYDL